MDALPRVLYVQTFEPESEPVLLEVFLDLPLQYGDILHRQRDNRYFRLDVQARKQSWQGCYLQSPIESPFISASVCSLPSSNEILLFRGGNISIRVQVFKHEHLLTNQHFFT